MDADETLVLLASCLLTAVAGSRWYEILLRRPLSSLHCAWATRLLLVALPMVLLIALYVTLTQGAAREVRDDGQYVVLFLALGASWLLGLAWALGWLGIHVRDDLLRWQSAGIAILACPLDENLEGPEPAPIALTRPTWFGAIWHNALSVLGLRRNPLGGFGGTLPVPSGG